MFTYPFEKLPVWQMAKELVVKVDTITNAFPGEEKFGLVSQMRRASVSICSNIAEGCGRNRAKDQSYFYRMANSSIMELLNHLLMAESLGRITKDDVQTIREINIEPVS